mmetsp:Transcript_62320/g.115663  ORF Transcript_62320/g.115663 Transcript_62320/m.115663 type:complete len:220 (+) Transcript_62320:95-754(+)
MGASQACCSGNAKGGYCDFGGPNDVVVSPPHPEVGLDIAPSHDKQPDMEPPVDAETGALEEKVPGPDTAAGGEEERVVYNDGSTYRGQMMNNKRNGHGAWLSVTGRYEGQWKDDVQHGQGRQKWSDGRVYEGEFAHGKFSGFGHMTWITPQGQLVYEGEYKDDLKHGKGKFTWHDGRVYDGDWFDGKRHGRALYTNASEGQKVGFWLHDKFDHWETTPA